MSKYADWDDLESAKDMRIAYQSMQREVKELEAKLEKYKSEIRESCEDMRSEYRTCDLAHELGEKNKELEAQVTSLERSRKLCHHYAGCTTDNCKLDGDNCWAAIKGKER